MNKFDQKAYDALWKCEYCGDNFPVPSLARDHELKCYCNIDAVSAAVSATVGLVKVA